MAGTEKAGPRRCLTPPTLSSTRTGRLAATRRKALGPGKTARLTGQVLLQTPALQETEALSFPSIVSRLHIKAVPDEVLVRSIFIHPPYKIGNGCVEMLVCNRRAVDKYVSAKCEQCPGERTCHPGEDLSIKTDSSSQQFLIFKCAKRSCVQFARLDH